MQTGNSSINQKPTVYIFRCSSATEDECFELMLFGASDATARQYQRVSKGDTLLLYNVQIGRLHGKFVAQSGLARDIAPNAWRHQFPWQVKVAYAKKYETVMRADLQKVIPFRRVTKGAIPISVLSRDQATAVERLFQENTLSTSS